MNAQSPSAYVSSALLHAAVAVALLLLGYELSQNQAQAPKIFELVVGPGDNYAATKAAALGSPDAPEIKVPVPPAPPEPAPAPPAPAPVAQAVAEPAPAPVPAKAPPKPAAKPAPNFLHTVQRTVKRAESRVETRIHRQQAAEARRQQQQESYDKFLKEHPEKVAQARGIATGVAGGSVANTKGGAGGKALSREQGSEMDAYYALLMSRIRENHQQPANVSTSLTAKVEFRLGPDGSISALRIVRSSGSAEFDQSIKEAFARTRPILPPSFFKGDTVSLTFSLEEDSSN
ncbi:MAG TPA: energy transducer TonB [Opitutaceae bacterium]|nr:energy transducer TonB [Opitutaceae bacterium]